MAQEHTYTEHHQQGRRNEGRGKKLLSQEKKKSAKVPRRMNCLVAEYRIPYRIGPRTITTHAHRAPPILLLRTRDRVGSEQRWT